MPDRNKNTGLRHILGCLLLCERLCTVDQVKILVVHLRFGTLREIQQRSKTCVLCQQLVQLVESFPGESEEGTDVTLSLNRFSDIVVVSNRNDWGDVASWFDECEIRHGDKCGLTSGPQHPPGFRLIDVTNSCVVTTSQFCKYAALSYVWGTDNKPSLEATTQNIRDLEKKGYLHKACIPATIRDAMIACTKMGIQYLWVDRLCIVQDHAHEKGIQINAMGTIYANSYVTLVGLAGHDANYGLPGVFKDERPCRQVLRVENIFVTEVYDRYKYEKLVEGSAWDSRGWTYQEALLSRRLLLFSHLGLFYECRGDSGLCGEPQTVGGCDRVPLFDKAMDPCGEEDLLSSSLFFSSLIEGYTKRVFSQESDILRAISGILNTIYESHHYFGLPFSVFDNAILWKAEATTHSKRIPASGAVFPSWSWVSAKSSITTNTKDLQNLAVWATASTDSDFVPQPLKLIAPWPRPPYLERGSLMQYISPYSVLLIMAWKEGCFSGKLPEELKPAASWSQIETLIQARWGANGQHRIIRDAHGLGKNIDYSGKFSPEHISMSRASPGGIMVYAQSVRLHLVPPQKLSGSCDEHVELYDEAGQIVACLDEKSVNKDWFLTTYGYRQSGIDLDLLALSLEFISVSHPEDEPELNGMTRSITNMIYSDRQRIPLGGHLYGQKAPIVHLMVIDSQDGLSRRVALAKTYLKIWVQAERKFGTFVLV
ncbi:heterokaryon incompatibility protein-domain-containing protein [Aspergillus minisclerotigenes]|uniref:Heterokaryon incompatibility protein-domain-containing protein n=1 Tax=Aspergillus minisclerotigenes TaxID=656917 RepID=A0A5N6JGY8_9EURO|nr:heterokaryon incompatibility protein-domain-containing protein [Aspergillus minisclerotigenes]